MKMRKPGRFRVCAALMSSASALSALLALTAVLPLPAFQCRIDQTPAAVILLTICFLHSPHPFSFPNLSFNAEMNA